MKQISYNTSKRATLYSSCSELLYFALLCITNNDAFSLHRPALRWSVKSHYVRVQSWVRTVYKCLNLFSNNNFLKIILRKYCVHCTVHSTLYCTQCFNWLSIGLIVETCFRFFKAKLVNSYLDELELVLLAEDLNVVGPPSPDTPAKYSHNVGQAD